MSRCAEAGAVTIARWGFARLVERCAWRDRDLRKQAEIRRRLDAITETQTLARCAELAAPDDEAAQCAAEEILWTMPIDPESADAKTRFCPWYSTGRGCLVRKCQLSHRHLPADKVTSKYRLWAFEVAPLRGWIGEPSSAAGVCVDI